MAENQWDARGYAQNARFVSDLGLPVVDWLSPQPGEQILDLGCGDGALTAKLAQLGVSVYRIDHSESMVRAAALIGLDVAQADMHAFQLNRQFDAIFTNAVLHWTRDIHAVLSQVRQHLKPDGRFVGEFGGFGNVAAIVTAVQAALQIVGAAPASFRWYFPTPAAFQSVLRSHGFEAERIELIPRPTPLPTGMRPWLETFAKPFVFGLDETTQTKVLDKAVDLLTPSLRDESGNWTADYVRLRFHAVLRAEPQA